MTHRVPIIGGNWKMHTTRAEASDLASAVRDGLDVPPADAEVVLFPPFPYLEVVGAAIESSPVRLGAQDVFHERAGAYTGEVSPDMLLDLGVSHVIVGHSERRHVIGEDEPLVRRKLHAAVEAGLIAVLCVGETLEDRDAGRVEEVNLRQVRSALDGLAIPDGASIAERLIIAYEPVWAIGSGRTATPDDAEAVHALLRRELQNRYDARTADAVRIQYGGSVKGSNAESLFARPEIDGGLIGGASLKGDEFLAIIRAASTAAAAAPDR